MSQAARPGGNATGFAAFETGIAAKWLQLLKEIAPQVTRVAVLRDPSVPAGSSPYGAVQVAASSFRVELVPIDSRDEEEEEEEVERSVATFAQKPNGGLILVAPAFAPHPDRLIALAARHRLPTIYPNRRFVDDGGPISYSASGPADQWRQAAGYIDRILKGAKPMDLPVQAPTRYELVINRKTATALGLDIPTGFLLRADEVIE